MEDRNNYGQVGFTHTPGCSGQIGEERLEASQLYHHQYAPGRGADILEFMRRARGANTQQLGPALISFPSTSKRYSPSMT